MNTIADIDVEAVLASEECRLWMWCRNITKGKGGKLWERDAEGYRTQVSEAKIVERFARWCRTTRKNSESIQMVRRMCSAS